MPANSFDVEFDKKGKVFNPAQVNAVLDKAEQFIKDHSDVTGHQVAYALLHAIREG